MQGPSKAAAAVADAAPSPQAEGAEMSRSWTAETRVSVVVPCYNEAATLPILYERLSTEARRWNVDHEVILVVPLFGGGRQPLQTVHLDDLCEVVARALERELTGASHVAETAPP